MGLVNCRSCKKEVDRWAEKCIHCGSPSPGVKNIKKTFFWSIAIPTIIMILILIISVSESPNSSEAEKDFEKKEISYEKMLEFFNNYTKNVNNLSKRYLEAVDKVSKSGDFLYVAKFKEFVSALLSDILLYNNLEDYELNDMLKDFHDVYKTIVVRYKRLINTNIEALNDNNYGNLVKATNLLDGIKELEAEFEKNKNRLIYNYDFVFDKTQSKYIEK